VLGTAKKKEKKLATGGAGVGWLQARDAAPRKRVRDMRLQKGRKKRDLSPRI